MAVDDDSRGYCGKLSNEDLRNKLNEDTSFLHSVVKAYFKDNIFGSKLKNEHGIGLSLLNDVLDDDSELAKKFNEDLLNFASGRIERNINVGLAHLTEEITKTDDDINSLRIIQSAIQTLSTVKRSFESQSKKENRKLNEFEQALHKLGL